MFRAIRSRVFGGRRRPAPVLVSMVLAFSACGGASEPTTASTITPATVAVAPTTAAMPTTSVASGFPISVEAANGTVTLERRPQAIVSLSPTATEMLFAVGAGDLVIAVDEFSYYPAEAPVTDLSGYTPNIEAITGYAPDLVVVADDIDGVVGALSILGIPVLQLPAASDLDDVYTQIEQIGAVTGHLAEAAAVVASMTASIDALIAEAPRPTTAISFFHEIDATLYTASSASFIGQIYGLLGLTNIADAVDTDDSFGFPQLSEEYVLQADPDIIFLADAAYGESAQTVSARPGWSGLSAVRNGLVIPMDADIASRWGPRLVEFLEMIAAAVAQAAAVKP